jgi:intracellular septation protein A
VAENVESFEPQSGSPTIRGMLPSLIVDAGLPAIAYQILTRHGVSEVTALTAGAIFPAASVTIGFMKTRRIDLIGALVLVFIAVGTVTSLISGNVIFVLVKESMLTAVFGAICLCSLLWSRPLMFYFGRQFAAGDDPARIEWWNGMWDRPGFRKSLRTITVVWGVGYILEALVRVVFALTLSPGVVVAISPTMAIGVTVLLIIWTGRYGRMARERALREAALTQG